MFRPTSILLSAILMVHAVNISAAAAASVTDPQQWVNSFDQVFQEGKQETVAKTLMDLPNQGFDQLALTRVIDTITSVRQGRDLTYVTKVQTTKLGDALSRDIVFANFATGKPLFILFDFVRAGDEWKLMSLHANNDVNVLLALPWPRW